MALLSWTLFSRLLRSFCRRFHGFGFFCLLILFQIRLQVCLNHRNVWPVDHLDALTLFDHAYGPGGL